MTRVLRWGGNLGLKIPSRVARAIGLEHGSEVIVTLEKGRIVVEPLRAVPTLERLLAGVTVQNGRHDLDWRPAVERAHWSAAGRTRAGCEETEGAARRDEGGLP